MNHSGEIEGVVPSCLAAEATGGTKPSSEEAKTSAPPSDVGGRPRSGEITGVVPSGEFQAAEATDGIKPSSDEAKTSAPPSDVGGRPRSGEINGVVPSGEFQAAEATDGTKPSSDEAKTSAPPSDERSAKMDKPSGENSAETAKPEMSIGEMLELLGPNHPIHYTFGLPNWVVGCMGFVSLPYVVVAPWLLWHAADQPLALVCTFSLLVCSYLFFWIICLSETMGVFTVFFRISYIALLSSFIAHLIGPINGMTVAYLDTFYAAGMLGYAIAEYRQLVGSERSASAVVTHSSESKEQQRRRDGWVCYVVFVQGLPSLVVLARMLWLVFVPDADRRILFVMMELSLETCFLSFFWSAFVALILLNGALISVDTVFCRVTVHFGAWYVLNGLLFVVGDAAGLLVLWLIAMVMVGFFGYSLAVRAHYKQILATRKEITG